MRKVSANFISDVAQSQFNVMTDLCDITHITHFSGTVTNVIYSGTVCGVQLLEDQEGGGRSDVVSGFDAVLRLPISQVISVGDLVDVTRKGNTVLNLRFQVASHPKYLLSIQKARLNKVRT